MRNVLVTAEKISYNILEILELLENLETLLHTQYNLSKEDQDKLKKLEKRYKLRLEQLNQFNSDSLKKAHEYLTQKAEELSNEGQRMNEEQLREPPNENTTDEELVQKADYWLDECNANLGAEGNELSYYSWKLETILDIPQEERTRQIQSMLNKIDRVWKNRIDSYFAWKSFIKVMTKLAKLDESDIFPEFTSESFWDGIDETRPESQEDKETD